MTNEEIRAELQRAIDEERVMLFMKGTPDAPRCGFSARVTQMLNASGADYSAMDILPDPRIREELSGLSGWPTIPQLFVGRRAGRRLRHRDRDVRVRRAGGDPRRRAPARAETPRRSAADGAGAAAPDRVDAAHGGRGRRASAHARHYTVEQANAALPWVSERLVRIRDALGELLSPESARARSS